MLAHALDPDGATVIEIGLARSRDAPAVARQAIEARFGALLSDRALQDARLVVSELVTNAITHGEGGVVLRARADAAVLHLEIVDEGAGEAPAIRRMAGDHTGGWGLRIVDAVALRWGTFEGTTHVWAELSLV